jgi:hypothetical protein
MEQTENNQTEIINEKIEIKSDVSLESQNQVVNNDGGVAQLPLSENVETIEQKSKRGGSRKGSGRKKRDGNNTNSQTSENSDVLPTGVIKEAETVEDALKGISKEINGKLDYKSDDNDTQTIQEQPKQEYAVLISGYVLLTVLNAIMPSLLVTLLGRFNSKVKKVNPKNIALDKDEMEMLQPSADELVKTIFSTMSPVNQFFFAYIIITSGKLLLEIQSIPDEKTISQ